MEPARWRTEVELEGRRSPMEPKGWRDESQTKAWKFMPKAEPEDEEAWWSCRGDSPRWSRGSVSQGGVRLVCLF